MKKSVQKTPPICGHAESGDSGVQEYNKTNLCTACYELIKNTEFVALSKLAAQQNEQSGLPKLKGSSDKQVAFAEIIRAEIIPQLEGVVLAKQRYTSSSEDAEYLSDCAAAWVEIAKKIKSVTTAEWFLNCKTNLIRQIGRGLYEYGEKKFLITTTDYEVLKKDRLKYLRGFKINGVSQEG